MPKSKTDPRISKFLQTIKENFETVDPQVFWPLNGGQIDAYFSDTQAAEIYDKIQILIKKGLSKQEIAKFFRSPVILRYFLTHAAIVGLKVCDLLKIRHFSTKERENFTLLLLDLLGELVRNDIFCSDGKNLIHTQDEVEDILVSSDFQRAAGDRQTVNNFLVTLFHLCNALYYDIFLGIGLEVHGPYNVERAFGKGSFLVIRDYSDLRPETIWPKIAKKIPFVKIRFLLVYKDTDWQINFFNQPNSLKGIGPFLEYFSVQVDGKDVTNLGEIERLDLLTEGIIAEQTQQVRNLAPLDQARKGAEIAYYMLRDFYTYFCEEPKPTPTVDYMFKKFGLEFIKKFAMTKSYPVSYYVKLFDPRNDFIG